MNPDETEVLGVSTGAYTANTESSGKNNRLSSAASAGVQAVNLLKNADMELAADLSDWAKDTSSSCNAATRSDSGTPTLVTPHLGQSLMKLYEPGITAGEYKVKQPVYLEADRTYVFSAYVNTACTGSFGTDGGAYLSFLQGTTLQAKSRVVGRKTNTAVDNGWERVEVSFTPSAPGVYAVAANVNNIENIAVFDDFQLEAVPDLSVSGQSSAAELGGTAASFNLLQAGSFEFVNSSSGAAGTAGVSSRWTFSPSASQVGPNTGHAHAGSFGLHLVPSVQGKRRASQIVPINDSSNKTYILSGWGWTPKTNISSSKEMEGDNSNECRFFGLIAKITYGNASIDPEYHYVSFNDSIGQWQFAGATIVPKKHNETISSVTVSVCLDYCVNEAYVDEISLIREPVQTYEYDDDGNLKEASNSEGQTSTEYDDHNRLTKYTTMAGVEYDLDYGNETGNRNPINITSDGVKSSYTYDDAGNATATEVQPTSGGAKLQSSATYDAARNFPTSSTDTAGNTSYTNYSTTTGLLQSATDPLGRTVYSTYNANNDRPAVTWQSGVAALHHAYDSRGRLEQLIRKSFVQDNNGSTAVFQAYHFDFDEWGNTTAIQVWKPTTDDGVYTDDTGTELAHYEYNADGSMHQMTYPNRDYVVYTYDQLDRLVKEAYYNSSQTLCAEYRYVYNANGQLARQYVVRNGAEVESYSFEYDSLGRLIRSREEGGSGAVQRTEHLYDTANRLTKQNWVIGSNSFTETYSYDENDGSLASATLGNGDRRILSYDPLKRLQGVTVKNSSNVIIQTREITYQNHFSDSTRTTGRLDTFVTKKADNTILVGNRYEYDANGNITKIYEVFTSGSGTSERLLAQYSYDALDQLATETRYTYSGTSTTPATTTTVTYVIDTAGNLRSVTGGEHSVSYVYGNGNWADKLTGITVDNVSRTISYADAANPSNWFNGTDYTNITWTQGRRLTELTKGSSTYSYEYDMSGVRTVKISDGKKHEYVTQNGRVVRELVTNVSNGAFFRCMDFIYDENGKPYALRQYWDASLTNYDTFRYVLNAQGDVIQLTYQGDTVYAQYSYDAWGNVLTATGSLADANPLRYRGYYYDTETGFYYLQSRYYDPIVKRFLNADSYGSTGQGFLGFNMFAYCGNNPVSAQDSHGYRDDEEDDDDSKTIWSTECDAQGVIILIYWLYGNGDDLVFTEGSWGSYMRKHNGLKDYVISIVNRLVVDFRPGQCEYIDITTSAVINNGESIVGYQYLHGTDANVGGFHIEGIVGKDYCGNTIYNIKCTWNDMINPNYTYSSDVQKVKVAHLLPGAKCQDYKISISWRMRTPSSYSPIRRLNSLQY